MELTTNQWLLVAGVLQTAVMLTLGTISLSRTLKLYADPEVSRQRTELIKAVDGWSNWLVTNRPKDDAARLCVVNAGRTLLPGFFMSKPDAYLKRLAKGRRELQRCKALCDLPAAA